VLSEGCVAMTGDKTVKPVLKDETDNVFELKRLAGLK
jgi:hypothetical protein